YVFPADQDLDRLGPGRRGAETAFLHRLAQLLVVDPLARGLHCGEQGRLGVAWRRLRLLVLELGVDALDCLALLELRQLSALFVVLIASAGLLVDLRFEPVNAAPAGLECDLAARAKPLFLDQRYHFSPLVPRRGMENGEKPARDQIED